MAIAAVLIGALTMVAPPALAMTTQWKTVPDVVVTDPAVQNLHVSPSHAYGAVLSWNNGTSVYASVQSATDGFSDPIEVARGLSTDYFSAVSADIGPDGTVVVGWVYESSSDHLRKAWAAVRPPGGTFGAPQVVSGGALSVNSLLTRIAPDGTTFFAFCNYDTDIAASKISYVTRSPSGTLRPLTVVQSGSIVSAPDTFAMDATGQMTFVWQNVSQQVVSKTLPFGGTLSGSEQLSTSGHRAQFPALSVAPGGDALVAWSDTLSGTTRIRGSNRPVGESWSSPESLTSGSDLAADGESYAANLSLGADGTMAVTWVVDYPTLQYQSGVKVAVRTPGGTWGTDLTVVPTTSSADLGYQYGPRLITQPDGGVTVTFLASGSTYTSTLQPDGSAFEAQNTLTGQNAAGLAVKPNGVVSAFPADATGFKIVSTEAPPTALTVERSGDGSGTVASEPHGIDCGTTCSTTLPLDGTVTLTAKPADGSVFAGWSGACHGTERTCTFTLATATAVTARFDRAEAATAAAEPTAPAVTKGPAAAAPHATAIALQSTTVCTGRICTTTGRMPAGAASITQRATRTTAARGRSRITTSTRVGRCAVTVQGMQRNYRCTIRLATGRWRITTRATRGASTIAMGLRSVRISATTPEPVTG